MIKRRCAARLAAAGATALGTVVIASACAPAPQQTSEAATAPVTDSTPSATPAGAPTTELGPATVAYLRAWAANDVDTMVSNAATDSPALAYARYWGDVFAAGRFDGGVTELTLGADSARLGYQDGSSSRLDRFREDAGLITWRARPGGELADRVVAGPPVTRRIGGVTVTVQRQYRNGDGDLRIVVAAEPAGSARRDLSTPRYRPQMGGVQVASAGHEGRTGVIPLPRGQRTILLTSVADAGPGGALLVRVFTSSGAVAGSGWLPLPAG